MIEDLIMRRLIILFYLDSEFPDRAELVNPPFYEDNIALLKKKGFIKNLGLTPKGEKITNKFPEEARRRIKRIYFSKQNRRL